MESPSSAAGSLNRFPGGSGLRRWCCPFWNLFWKGHHPGSLRIPDVTEGVAQDRKRQESQADFKVEE
ncbi:hypothetical protein GCM10009429_13950 [Dyella marensis]